MKSAGKARSNGLYRHIRTSKEIIRNLLNYYTNIKGETAKERLSILFSNEQIKRLGKANRISLSNSYTLITAEQWMNIYYYSKIGLTDEKKKKFQDAYKKLQKMNKKLKKQNRTSLRKSSSNKKCRTRIDTSNGTKNR